VQNHPSVAHVKILIIALLGSFIAVAICIK